MVLYTPQPSWRYAIFQIPAMLMAGFLLLALLTHFGRWFGPTVSVQMMLDLSSSTYENTNIFKGQGTIMQAEIEAAINYARQNAAISNPNLLSLSGFADRVVPITQNFSKDPAEIEKAIEQVVQPAIKPQLGEGTNLNLAVEKGLNSLSSQSPRCKEMLVITDGQAELNPILLSRAKFSRVRLNFLIVGQPVPADLNLAAQSTGGLTMLSNTNNISALVGGQFRERFNSNSKLVNFFLGLSWVSLMWMLVLPLDRFLQNQMKMRFDFSGRIALSNAFFWTVLICLWLGLPVLQGC